MSTFLHGVGTVQYLDKSAEVVDLKGLDISSLSKTGVINYEHKSDIPAQLVGKILKAKKIFKESDCSDEHELYFWKKVKTPYLYIMAELLDDYCDSAKHVAGILRYDRDKKEQNEYAMAWFSVEGSEIPGSRTNSQIVSRGIARKVTITTSPCNQGCAVEILENQKPQIVDDFESIFKNKQEAINLFKSGEGIKRYETFLAKKEAQPPSAGGRPPKSPSSEYEGQGIREGTTRSGNHVASHGHIGDYDFNPAEHQESGEHHEHANVTAQNPKLTDNKTGRKMGHTNATITGARQENRAALSLVDKDKIALQQGKQVMQKNERLCKKHKKIKKDDMGGSVDTSPPEPNPANAAAMQAGATSSGVPSMSEAFTNIKEGLGMGKSETPSWSSGKVKGNSVHFTHPEHGTVSIQKQPSGDFHVKHQGKLAGVGGVKGSFGTSKEAGAHAKKYMQSVSQKKIFAPKMQNISSDALLGKADDNKCNLHKAKIDESKDASAKITARSNRKNEIPENWSLPTRAGTHLKEGSPIQAKLAHEQSIKRMKDVPKPKLEKALTAGFANSVPSTLVNGAAYQKESLNSKPATTGAEEHKFQGTKKKDWNKRAKEDYERWPHKEKFEKFMQARMPHLAMGEIQAIGRVLSLKKNIGLEKSLNELVSLKKSEKSDKVDLVHYSSHPNLKEVDPKFHGTGVDSRTKGRDTWHPHSFYYRAGTEPEGVVTGRAPHKYIASINTKQQPIYDIGKDPEGYVGNSPNMDAVHEKLKDKGYHGFHNSKHDSLSHVVAMYHPLKVEAEKLVAKSDKSLLDGLTLNERGNYDGEYVINVLLAKSENSSANLGSHFLMSAENPLHPHKNELKMNHEQTLAHLKSKGFKANAVKGHYGAPETSIMVHGVNPKQAEDLHGIASKLGQDSSIYSSGGKHEMRFHHGENKGKKITGEGTVFHKEKPKDMYTTLPNGQHFTHNFNFDKSEGVYMSLIKSEDIGKELDEKSLKQIQKETALKWCARAEEAYKRAIKEKSVKWLTEALEYGHEAIEHSSLGEELEVFEKVRAKLMPLHKEATELLVSKDNE